MEARSIDSKMLTRRCAVAKLKDVTMTKYRDLMTQNAGALLVILPNNFMELSAEEKQVNCLDLNLFSPEEITNLSIIIVKKNP